MGCCEPAKRSINNNNFPKTERKTPTVSNPTNNLRSPVREIVQDIKSSQKQLQNNIDKVQIVSNENENINGDQNLNIKDSILSSINFDNSTINLSANPEIDEKDRSPFISVNQIDLNCIKTIEAHDEKVVCLTELSSGKIATGSYDCRIKIWNLNTYECEKTLNENGYVFCLLEFEKNMLLSGTSENKIQLWDLNNAFSQNLHSFEGHLLWINCLVKCNQSCFASCSNDSDIRIWNYYTKKCKTILEGHNDCVLALIKLNDGRLCSGSSDLTIKIWNWELNICDATLTGHKKWVKCLCQLNNGYIISGSDDKTIKIWKEENILESLSDTHSVRALCQINDNLFASASFDKTIKIWSLNNMKCIQTLEGHQSYVTGIIYHSSGCLISCSNDHTIKIWK